MSALHQEGAPIFKKSGLKKKITCKAQWFSVVCALTENRLSACLMLLCCFACCHFSEHFSYIIENYNFATLKFFFLLCSISFSYFFCNIGVATGNAFAPILHD